MQLIPAKVSGLTDASGLASLQLKPDANAPKSVLIARRGNDGILPEDAESIWASNGPGIVRVRMMSCAGTSLTTATSTGPVKKRT